MSGRGILDADMTTVGGWIVSAARWWLDEMRAMVPPALRDRFAQTTAQVTYQAGNGTLEPEDEATTPLPGAPISVVLPPDLCLIRTIERPAMSERDLASMITLERDRIMPLGESGMVLAGRVVSRNAATGRMWAEVAGLPQNRAAALGMALTQANRMPAHVWVSPPQPAQGLPIDLLPALRDAGLVAPASRTAATLWFTVLALFALNVGLLVWRDAAAVSALDDVVSQQQPAVDTAHRIIARIRKGDAVAAATLTARRTREPLAILARIDAALPPGTWLQRLSWQGDSLRLTGYHPAQADVSAALRRAGFGVMRYGDTATTGQTPLGQPFEVTVRLGRP